MRPYLEILVAATFSGPQATVEKQALESWSLQPGAKTPPDSQVARRILSAHHVQSDINHQQIRDLGNLLYFFFAAVTAIDCAL
jgi:hypothetical protein